MTWWDHETNSTWSQPWGTAISGPSKGSRLEMIPVSIIPWASWRAEHPDTLALAVSGSVFGGSRARPRDGFVVGVVLEEHAKALSLHGGRTGAGAQRRWGPNPVVVFADLETRNVRIYLRDTGDQVLPLCSGAKCSWTSRLEWFETWSEGLVRRAHSGVCCSNRYPIPLPSIGHGRTSTPKPVL